MRETNPYYQWLVAKKLSPNTLYLYWRYYVRFSKLPFNQEGITKFFSDKKVNNSISRAFMKSLLEFLGMEDRFELPPKPTGKKKKKIIRGLTQNQIQQIRDGAYQDNQIIGFLFDFLYYGALRRSEVAKLRINSLNWSLWFEDPTKSCELKIELAKGNKERIVLLPCNVVKNFLDFYMKQKNIKPYDLNGLIATLNNTSQPIFVQSNGNALQGGKVWRIVKQISNKAIDIDIRPHEIRHARATELEKNGMSIRSIQHYLGHSTPQITEVYLHTTEKQSLSKIKDFMDHEN